MRSLLGEFLNRSPVPLSPTRNGSDVINILGGGGRQNRHLSAQSSVGTVFAIVNRLSTAVAKAEWTFYEKAASGIKEDRTPVLKHPMIDLWRKPNPFMNRRRFIETAQQHVELVGENALIASTARIMGNDIPIELWPTRPDRIQVVPDPYEFIAGYVYHGPDGQKVPLEVPELYRILMPNASDPYRGLGAVQSILTDLDNVKYSSEWNRAFFMNSAEPGGVIEVPVTLNDAEFTRLRDQWAQTHQGVAKAHRVAIIEAGAKWVSNSFTHKDMQFAELRTLSRDIILEAWGFPKSVLGIVEDVNRANAEASEYMFAKWMVVERLDRWKDLLNDEILPRYGNGAAERYEWDYESPVPENSEQDNAAITAKSQALATLTEKGFDPEKILEFFGWPEFDYEKPEPKVVQVPANPNEPGQGGNDE